MLITNSIQKLSLNILIVIYNRKKESRRCKGILPVSDFGTIREEKFAEQYQIDCLYDLPF